MSWQRAVRDERYKLIEYCVDENRHTQLFDLKTDPNEINNLAGNPDFAGHLYKMRTLLKSEKVKQNDGNTSYEFTNKQGEKFWNTYNVIERSVFPGFN